jgi:hypothetical protein
MVDADFQLSSDSDFPRYMRRTDAARYISERYFPCVGATLAKLACTGSGPAFRKAGKFPLYTRDDLDAWAKQRLSKLVRSTSEVSDQRGESAA